MNSVVLFTRAIGKGLVVRPMKSFPFLEGFFDFIRLGFLQFIFYFLPQVIFITKVLLLILLYD